MQDIDNNLGGIVLEGGQISNNTISAEKPSTAARIRRTARRIRRNGGLYLLILPAFALLLCFSYIPMYGVIIAFKNYIPAKGILGSPWVGMANFNRYFHSYAFWPTIKNTLLISLYGLAAGFPIPIILAIMVNQMNNKRYKKLFQTVSSMPHFISTVVMVGMILIFLSPSTGLIGNICRLFGKEAPNLMASSSLFSSIYVWTDVWQHTGWDSIIYIAALSAVDVSLYEAATVDGANIWHKIIYIDLPMLLPTACILLILRCGSILNLGFEKIYLMQNNMNASASEIIATYVYKIGLLSSQYSLSSAINLFSTAINFILLFTVNKITDKLTQNGLW